MKIALDVFKRFFFPFFNFNIIAFIYSFVLLFIFIVEILFHIHANLSDVFGTCFPSFFFFSEVS